MKIKANEVYLFLKSGNLVRAIEREGKYLGQPLWIVASVDTAKEMLVPEVALAKYEKENI